MRRISLACLLTAALFASSCDEVGSNYIEGSLAEIHDIEFETVRILLYSEDLSIEYIDSEERVALRATVRLPEGGLQTGVRYNLLTQGDITRGSNLSPLPDDQESGELEFDTVSMEDGSAVEGTFSGVFFADDGSRMTLRAGFAENLKVVDL